MFIYRWVDAKSFLGDVHLSLGDAKNASWVMFIYRIQRCKSCES
jgi:hypothetical protein